MTAVAATPEQLASIRAKLGEYNFGILVDVSRSMEAANRPDGKGPSRINYIQEQLERFLQEVDGLDDDGVDFVVYGGTIGCIHISEVTLANYKEKVVSQLKTGGSTPMAQAIGMMLQATAVSPKKRFLVNFTDGEPDDKLALEKIIINQANSQSADNSCTIGFIQVGDDPDSTTYLNHLDNELTGKAKFDIVSVLTVKELAEFPTISEAIVHMITN